SYRGGGQEFALDVNKVSNNAMTLQLLHFSGYGGGDLGSGDTFTTTFLDPLARVRQPAPLILDKGRGHIDDDGNVIPPELTQAQVLDLLAELVADLFNKYLFPALDLLSAGDCNLARIHEIVEVTLGALRTVEFLGLEKDYPNLGGLTASAIN